MGLQVSVDDEALDVRFEGSESLLSFARHVRIPMSEIVSARVAPLHQAKAEIGWRVMGGYWPGWFATGNFTVPGRKGARQLWCVYRDDEVLIVDTRLERPARLVLQHPDRDRLAWWINERVED